MLGVGDALRADPRVFVYGEDVGGTYGNAFLLLRPLLKEFGDRILNSPLAEGAVLGVCVGAALAGQRPIGEMQFNDFVATGFNQLVNNAAKIRYRWGGGVPMVVRMPWGGLRHAGPVPHPEHRGVVLPHAGPEDRRALDAARRARADGVGRRRSGSGALLRAHRALPRSAHQAGAARRARRRRSRSARRRCGATGDDLAIISYGAYVHVALRVAETARGGRHRGQRARPAHASRRSTGRRCSRVARHCQPRADRPRGLAHRRHRREPRRDHPGRGVRVARRAGPHRRRARHAGAVLAAARGVLPAVARREIERAARLLVAY